MKGKFWIYMNVGLISWKMERTNVQALEQLQSQYEQEYKLHQPFQKTKQHHNKDHTERKTGKEKSQR